MDELKLKCALAGQTADCLVIDTDVGNVGHGAISAVTVLDGDATASIYLTEDTARQLFNWLGVLLHGG